MATGGWHRCWANSMPCLRHIPAICCRITVSATYARAGPCTPGMPSRGGCTGQPGGRCCPGPDVSPSETNPRPAAPQGSVALVRKSRLQVSEPRPQVSKPPLQVPRPENKNGQPPFRIARFSDALDILTPGCGTGCHLPAGPCPRDTQPRALGATLGCVVLPRADVTPAPGRGCPRDRLGARSMEIKKAPKGSRQRVHRGLGEIICRRLPRGPTTGGIKGGAG